MATPELESLEKTPARPDPPTRAHRTTHPASRTLRATPPTSQHPPVPNLRARRLADQSRRSSVECPTGKKKKKKKKDEKKWAIKKKEKKATTDLTSPCKNAGGPSRPCSQPIRRGGGGGGGCGGGGNSRRPTSASENRTRGGSPLPRDPRRGGTSLLTSWPKTPMMGRAGNHPALTTPYPQRPVSFGHTAGAEGFFLPLPALWLSKATTLDTADRKSLLAASLSTASPPPTPPPSASSPPRKKKSINKKKDMHHEK